MAVAVERVPGRDRRHRRRRRRRGRDIRGGRRGRRRRGTSDIRRATASSVPRGHGESAEVGLGGRGRRAVGEVDGVVAHSLLLHPVDQARGPLVPGEGLAGGHLRQVHLSAVGVRVDRIAGLERHDRRVPAAVAADDPSLVKAQLLALGGLHLLEALRVHAARWLRDVVLARHRAHARDAATRGLRGRAVDGVDGVRDRRAARGGRGGGLSRVDVPDRSGGCAGLVRVRGAVDGVDGVRDGRAALRGRRGLPAVDLADLPGDGGAAGRVHGGGRAVRVPYDVDGALLPRLGTAGGVPDLEAGRVEGVALDDPRDGAEHVGDAVADLGAGLDPAALAVTRLVRVVAGAPLGLQVERHRRLPVWAVVNYRAQVLRRRHVRSPAQATASVGSVYARSAGSPYVVRQRQPSGAAHIHFPWHWGGSTTHAGVCPIWPAARWTWVKRSMPPP